MKHTTIALTLLAALAACGDKKPPAGGSAGSAAVPAGDAAAAEAPLPALGVDSPRKLNYVYGAGAKDHERAVAAYKAKPRDWVGVRAAAEAALLKDGDHLDAHHLLAAALAQAGDHAAATPHLTAALAGDWLRWGPTLAGDADLAGYLASPEGKQLLALSDRMKAEVARRIASGLIVLGRRGAFKWPAKPGAQWATSRGEVYAYDLTDKRFLRLTHTDHAVAAYLPSPSGKEIAVVGYDKVEVPDPTKKEAPPILLRAWVETVDPATWATTGKRATLGKARAIAIHYGAGEQLLATSFAAQGRWGLGTASTVSIDRSTGKAARTSTPADLGPRAVISFDEATVEAPAPGIESTWTEPTFTIAATGKVVTVPESGKVERSTVAVSPGGKRVAFATSADPCAKDGAVPSLYTVDSATAQIRHILTADSRFGARWVDDDRLAYEDDAGGVRVFDAVAGREALRITDKAGLALRGLGATPRPLCKQEPLAVEVDTSGEAALPPEEEAGPATAP